MHDRCAGNINSIYGVLSNLSCKSGLYTIYRTGNHPSILLHHVSFARNTRRSDRTDGTDNSVLCSYWQFRKTPTFSTLDVTTVALRISVRCTDLHSWLSHLHT